MQGAAQTNGNRFKTQNLNGSYHNNNNNSMERSNSNLNGRRHSSQLTNNRLTSSKTGNIPFYQKPSTLSRSAAPSPTPCSQPRAPANPTPTSPTSAYILPPSFGQRAPATSGVPASTVVTSQLPTPNKSYTVNIINNCNTAPVPSSNTNGACGRNGCCKREKTLLSEVLHRFGCITNC